MRDIWKPCVIFKAATGGLGGYNQPEGNVGMLQRTLIGVLLVGLFVAMLVFGPAVQAIVFTVGGIIAVHEMKNAFSQKGYKLFLVPVYAFAGLFGLWQLLLPGLGWLLPFVVLTLIIMAEHVLNVRRTLTECFLSMVIMVYPLLLLALLLQLGLMEYLGITALLLAFACPLLGDTLAYFVGSAIGKRPLNPKISPKKTVEGSIASCFGSMLAGIAVYFLQFIWAQELILPFWICLIIGLLCGFFGQVGDLFASSIKRWAQIKDFSRLLPGHGGVLDRVDSVLFCVPVVYACTMLYLFFG
ncbi:phosphatidate cytidylyltransferase [Eubacteriales bacterium OttesenSCG-928-K08]|nr:phosphatidate cytidylyltransferase [Eubacteriales bacterium OttesenSCG-928-K08]